MNNKKQRKPITLALVNKCTSKGANLQLCRFDGTLTKQDIESVKRREVGIVKQIWTGDEAYAEIERRQKEGDAGAEERARLQKEREEAKLRRLEKLAEKLNGTKEEQEALSYLREPRFSDCMFILRKGLDNVSDGGNNRFKRDMSDEAEQEWIEVNRAFARLDYACNLLTGNNGKVDIQDPYNKRSSFFVESRSCEKFWGFSRCWYDKLSEINSIRRKARGSK